MVGAKTTVGIIRTEEKVLAKPMLPISKSSKLSSVKAREALARDLGVGQEIPEARQESP